MKYNYTVDGNTVIAIGSYAGKPVTAKAVCADCDTFDAEIGKKIAAKRLDLKIWKKRLKRANKMYNAAMVKYAIALADFDDRTAHLRDVFDTLNQLEIEYDKLIASV